MKFLALFFPLRRLQAAWRRFFWVNGCATLVLATAPLPALAALNDTGQVTCFKGSRISTKCTGTGQDADHGRDVDVPRAKDGWRGFQFVKVCNSGSVAGKGGCLASAVQGPGPNDWGCTQDKVTGLMWELKTTDGGLHDRSRQFNLLSGHPSSVGVQVAAVNAAGLCGQGDWRTPTVDELLGLGLYHEFSTGEPFPGLDPQWFPDKPNVSDPRFWTSEALIRPNQSIRANWTVRFGANMDVNFEYEFTSTFLRLVRSVR